MSNVKQLPIQLQKLGLERFEQLYPQQSNESEVIRLLALSDFAWRCLESQPTLKDWLLCKDEIQNRQLPLPLIALNLVTLTMLSVIKSYESTAKNTGLKSPF